MQSQRAFYRFCIKAIHLTRTEDDIKLKPLLPSSKTFVPYSKGLDML